VEEADEQGLLAIGGDLSPNRLLVAYRSGVFPWFSEGGVFFWFSPDPRFVLRPNEVYISKSMRQLFRRQVFTVTLNHDFLAVIQHCALVQRDGQGSHSWISEAFVKGYYELHKQGWAHSVEVWQNGALVGGLYGVAIGTIFSGESMFATVSNASKFGFIALTNWLAARNFTLIDCQCETPHLGSLGASDMPRTEFIRLLTENNSAIPLFSSGIAERLAKIELLGC
jgi:leucyl/phenylalanyl-tRNA---protein transferase